MSTLSQKQPVLTPAIDPAKDRRTDLDGAPKSVSMTPVLSHRLKHDKSILALVVSVDCIFAGTEGGEIIVLQSRP
jgi:di- and tripeptidase